MSVAANKVMFNRFQALLALTGRVYGLPKSVEVGVEWYMAGAELGNSRYLVFQKACDAV